LKFFAICSITYLIIGILFYIAFLVALLKNQRLKDEISDVLDIYSFINSRKIAALKLSILLSVALIFGWVAILLTIDWEEVEGANE